MLFGRTFIVANALSLLLSVHSFSQPLSDRMLPTNVPDTWSYPAPPAGFDAINATDNDLAAYGLPPRPKTTSRLAYSAWARVVSRNPRRVDPVIRRTDVRHAGLQLDNLPANSNARSSNWSGEAVSNGLTTFGTGSFDNVVGEFNVPIAQQAFGTCNGNMVYEATWVGLDGFINSGNDVLQAGINSNATCSGGNNVGTYSAWYAWAPNTESIITNLAISPGDEVYVEVYASGTTTGNAYILDETSNVAVSVQFAAPAGTVLIGASAEWIVERPYVGIGLTTLTNYVASWMGTTVATTYPNSTAVYGGQPPSGITGYNITMQDSNKITISTALAGGGASLSFHDAGSAK